MKRHFSLLLILFSFISLATAQEVQIKQESHNSYSFSTNDLIRIKDFEFVSAITTDKPDVYIINIKALTADKKADQAINGKILFEINGKQELVDFAEGLGKVRTAITGTDKITMRDVDSDITRTGNIQHAANWGKIAGLALAVAVLAAVILWRKRKKELI